MTNKWEIMVKYRRKITKFIAMIVCNRKKLQKIAQIFVFQLIGRNVHSLSKWFEL